jgi:hypothetical protein
MQQKHSNDPGGGSTMVKQEPLSHYPRMVGSNPAADNGGEEIRKKFIM